MLPMPRIVRPDLFRIRETEIGFPARSTPGRSIKRNKELRAIFRPGNIGVKHYRIRRLTTGENGCERCGEGGKPEREFEYRYCPGALFYRSVAGSAVRWNWREEVFSRVEVALLFSASLGVVHNWRRLLRDHFRVRLPGSSTPSDNAVPKYGINAPCRCSGSQCSLEHPVFSDKESQSHLLFFTNLFARCYCVLVLLNPV